MFRFNLINKLIETNNYKSYLEIGVNKFECFSNILCDKKECVDPFVNSATYIMTSDDFFLQNKNNYDIIFIDGLHLEKQVLKDIENSLEIINENGAIVVHDCLPENEHQQRDIPKYDGIGDWRGTVWKAFARLRMTRNDLYMCVLEMDSGCGIIKKGKQNIFGNYSDLQNLNYQYYEKNKKELMNTSNGKCFDFYSKELK